MEEEKLIRIYSGTETTTQLLKEDLENAGINSLLRSDPYSGEVDGVQGELPSSVDLYIEERYWIIAEPVIDHFISVNEQ